MTKFIEVNGWELAVGADEVPRVKDLDLGARLGYANPSKFRQLVARMYAAGKFNDSEVITRAGKTSASGGRPSVEYLLGELATVLAIMRAESRHADAIAREIAAVYLAVRSNSVTPALPITLDVAHGRRVGETSDRTHLTSLCRMAAAALGVTIHRIHGAVRREYGVPSVYDVGVVIWPTVQRYIERLALRQTLLPGSRSATVLQLVRGGVPTRQLAIPGVSV